MLVIDDGSTDPASHTVLEEMRGRYPQFRFLTQPNAGIGATRNRGLWEARGEYFLVMDADNIARPDMVARFVIAMQRNADLGAMTCYFLAFAESEHLRRGEYRYAYRPTGGPHILASLRNVYGDANALYHTARFRAVGGYETDRATSYEDWEAFVKLVQAGYRVDVIPEHLFYYRHLSGSFTRVTSDYHNRARVLRQFFRCESLPAAERVLLWTTLTGLRQQVEAYAARDRLLIYRMADRLHTLGERVPRVKRCVKAVLTACGLL